MCNYVSRKLKLHQRAMQMAYSTYYQELDEGGKARYREKLAMLGSIDDPYLINTTRSTATMIDWQHWPDVEHPDIFNYLVATPNIYTEDQLKAYKSLDAYNFFVNGWVSDVIVISLASRSA